MPKLARNYLIHLFPEKLPQSNLKMPNLILILKLSPVNFSSAIYHLPQHYGEGGEWEACNARDQKQGITYVYPLPLILKIPFDEKQSIYCMEENKRYRNVMISGV